MTEQTVAAPLQGSIAGLAQQINPPKLPNVPKSGFARAGDKLVAVVTRDVTDQDVRQSVDFTSKQPVFDKYGRPEWTMAIHLNVVDFPETDVVGSEARMFADRGLLRTIMKAVNEAGHDAPKAGARLEVTLDSYAKVEGRQYKRKDYSATYTPSENVTEASPAPSVEAPKAEVPAQATPSDAPDMSNLTPEQRALFESLKNKSS